MPSKSSGGAYGLPTNTQVRDLLESFTDPNDYFSASFIKDLPGANVSYKVDDFNASGAGWYELYRIEGSTENHFAAEFLVRMSEANRTEFARIIISGNLDNNSDGYLKISEKTVRSDQINVVSQFTQVRLLKDSPTSNTARVLAYLTPGVLDGALLSLYDAPQLTETYGSFNPFDMASVPDAEILWEEDMSDWLSKGIKESLAGFLATSGVKGSGTASLELSGNDVQLSGEDINIRVSDVLSIDGIVMLNGENVGDTFRELRGSTKYPNYSETSYYNKGDYTYVPTLRKAYRNVEATPNPAGAFNASLWDDISNTSNNLPENIRDRLQELEMDDRLDASAIKNLPSNSPPIEGVLNPNGGEWIDLVVWDDLPATTSDGATAEVTLYSRKTTGEFVFETKLAMFINRSTDKAGITILNSVSDYDNPETPAVYRIAKDAGTPTAKVRLQFFSGLVGDHVFGIYNNLSIPYGSDVTFGALALNSTTLIPVKELEALTWAKGSGEDVVLGTSGRIQTTGSGNYDSGGSHIEYTPTELEHYVGDSLTLKSTAEGTIISGSGSGDFSGDTFNITSTTLGDAVNRDSEFGEIKLSCTARDWKHSYAFQHWAGIAHHGYYPSAVGKKIDFAVDSTVHVLPDVHLEIEVDMWNLTPDSGTFDFEWIDSGGNVLATETVQSGRAYAGVFQRFRQRVPVGETGLAINALSGSKYGIVRYRLHVVIDEADLSDHLVTKIHSYTRAFDFPALIDTGARNFETGNMRKDPASGRPQTYVADGWNYLESSRFGLHTSPYFVSYYADLGSGSYSKQGWDIVGYDSKFNVVKGQFGYPALLRIADDSSSSISGMFHTLSREAEMHMWTHGFRWDFTMRVESGRAVSYIEVTNNYSSGSGRWIFSADVSGGTLIISDVGGSSTIDLGGIDRMVHYSVRAEPNSNVGKLYANNVYLFDLTFQAKTITQGAMRHTSGSTPSDDEVFYLLDSTFFAIDGVTRNLTREEVEGTIRYNIPSIENAITITVPRGTYNVGTSFSVVNGSSKGATIKGLPGDPQLFAGDIEFTIPPYHEVTFTQTAYLRGNNWAASLV